VNREVQAAVLLVVGVVLGRLALSDALLAYVKASLRLPLLLSAAVLLVLGLLSVVRDREDVLAELATPSQVPSDRPSERDRVKDDDPHGQHGHDHATAPKIGWLVLVPILALLLVAPPALGAYAAGRGGANWVAVPESGLGPLPEAVDGAVPLTLGDAVVRALYEPDGPVRGTPVRLVGFVARDDAGGVLLSRFAVSCCAADANVRQVLLAGAGSHHEQDTWLEVVARFEGAVDDPDGDGGATGTPVFEVLSERTIEPPRSPYE
jgi:uncharacterized repeat protein (TIGR03943 family)